MVPIIGGGPAGMSCALWLHNYGLRPVIIEKEPVLGGMARRSPYPNEWLLGRPGESARENAAAFVRHIRTLAIETWLGAEPRHARCKAAGLFELEIARQSVSGLQTLSAPAIVIATGTSFAGEAWLNEVKNARYVAESGRLHLGPTAVGEPGTDLGSQIAVIGGGDNAFDVSRMLAERGVNVSLVMRSQQPKAQPLLVERLRPHQASGKATVMAGRAVTALDRTGSRVRVRLDDGREIEVDHVVLLFGYQPNTGDSWLAELALAQDAHGYVMVDGNMQTSCRGVFAAGDVANPALPNIVTAIAAGAIAAREIQTMLAR
jgi:thioredoxin reductase (NADPH)